MIVSPRPKGHMYNSAFFPWVVSHLNLIGWPVAIGFTYKLLRFVFKAGQTVSVVCQRILDGEDTLHKVATNHLPHLQLAMEDTNETLKAIREDLRLLMVKE